MTDASSRTVIGPLRARSKTTSQKIYSPYFWKVTIEDHGNQAEQIGQPEIASTSLGQRSRRQKSRATTKMGALHSIDWSFDVHRAASL
jgi:hypothetical protein